MFKWICWLESRYLDCGFILILGSADSNHSSGKSEQHFAAETNLQEICWHSLILETSAQSWLLAEHLLHLQFGVTHIDPNTIHAATRYTYARNMSHIETRISTLHNMQCISCIPYPPPTKPSSTISANRNIHAAVSNLLQETELLQVNTIIPIPLGVPLKVPLTNWVPSLLVKVLFFGPC